MARFQQTKAGRSDSLTADQFSRFEC